MLRTRRDPTRAQAAAPPSRSNIAASRAAPRHRQARRAEHDPRQARALDADERRIVEQHPRHSEEILARVAAFAAIAEIAGAHHERLDGSGYPDGRTLEQLSLAMRILAVADVFEAMTAERPYRTAMTTEEALDLIRKEAGLRLCAVGVGALEQTFASGETLARLSVPA